VVPYEVEERQQLLFAVLHALRPNAEREEEPPPLSWFVFDVEEQSKCINNDINARYAHGIANGPFENYFGLAESGRSAGIQGAIAAEPELMQQIPPEIEGFRIRP